MVARGISVAKSGVRILLVEDHIDTAKALSRLLDLSGYEVEHAATVASAIELSVQTKFDLLISDIGLPDGTGYELMKVISRQSRIPGIVLSGFGMDHDLQKAQEAGFTEHLTKPVAFDALQDAIKRVIAE